MAIAVAAGRQGVDRRRPVAGPHQRVDQQAAIDLDADHHLLGLLGVIGDQRVQLRQARHPDPEAPPPEHRPALVHHHHVVVGLGPVDAHEDHARLPRIDLPAPSPRSPRRTNGSVLYRHAIPPAVCLLAGRQGHALAIGLEARDGTSAHLPTARRISLSGLIHRH